MTEETAYEGGCHCGSVRFRVTLDVSSLRALDCDCSICRKKGFVHAIVPPESFELLRGAEALTEYRFGTRVAVHLFCSTCGVHPFYTPRSHPDHVDINLRCLDEDLLDVVTVEPFHGRDWERHVASIRDEP